MTFLGRRLLRSTFTLWVVLTAVFFATRMSGDPIQFLLPDGAPVETETRLRTLLGLDEGIGVQYARYLTGLVQGEAGLSFYQRRPVSAIYAERIGPTLQVAGLAWLLSTVLGLSAGILAALHHNRALDRTLMTLSFVGYSMPAFVLAIGLILVFSFHLNVLPASGQGTALHLLMPVLAIALPSAATLARFMRSSLLDVLSADYNRTARAKGLRARVVVLKHALRNALLPILTLVGLQIGTLVTGSVVVETVFAWPGVGSLLVGAVTRRDFPVLQFGVVIVAASIVVANFAVDLLYTVVDPRVRVS